MGTCLSKKKEPIVSIPSPIPLDQTKPNSKTEQQEAEHKTENPIITEKKKQEEQDQKTLPKKEIFIIKHRKSHDSNALTTTQTTPTTSIEEPENPQITINNNNNVPKAETKIEDVDVDAILIQCGRLSRSSSGKTGSRKYAGSKRSFDFDAEDCTTKQENSNNVVEEDEDYNGRRRNRSRESRTSPSRRRRTPSRERDQQQQQQVSQQRSGSRERSSSNGGRRVSRSPGRRSENTMNSVSAAAENGGNRPGKMVPVPASVDSGTGSVRRISVKRNVGSPRSQSPAKVAAAIAASNEKQPSLSRSNSRKAEQSPYRRNPMGEIDQNNNSYKGSTVVNKVQRSKDVEADLGVKEQSGYRIQAANQKPNVEISTNKIITPAIANKISRPTIENNKAVNVISRSKEQLQHQIVEDPVETNTLQPRTVNYVAALPSTLGGEESLKPQALTRSRSARRSRDLDINPESLSNPNPSYTTLLLEDIQNFHQKSNPAPAPALTPNPKSNPSFSLPPCVTKAQSILEAVADLNSCTSSNLSSVFSDDQKCNKNDTKRSYPNDPFVESEVGINDDLMEPSFQKYVTVRRGIVGGDMEEQESSGSNSFVGSQQHWNSSGGEPNSADSTDCWTSRLKEREEEKNVLGLEEARRGFSGRKRDDQRLGIGQGRIGSGSSASRGVNRAAIAAATSS
ncbi:hypothetical protein RJ641_020095 [Dillenia turbinata]|uniref:Uncharacterized protein n=1 Tax=Dillenia turbinata TaxID=194707 RepID=A0AAN8UDW0_9MAGN